MYFSGGGDRMIVVTGATGQLGTLVVDELLKRTEPRNIIAAVRTPSKAEALSVRGVQVRLADYNQPETLVAAFEGASQLLLVSGTELGKRVQQHSAAIDAAKKRVSSLSHTPASFIAIHRLWRLQLNIYRQSST